MDSSGPVALPQFSFPISKWELYFAADAPASSVSLGDGGCTPDQLSGTLVTILLQLWPLPTPGTAPAGCGSSHNLCSGV